MNTAIKSPIHQDAFELDPASQAALKLSDEVHWAFSILFGRCGGKEVPLLSDVDGNLMVSDKSGALAELYAQLKGTTDDTGPLWHETAGIAEWVHDVEEEAAEIDGRLVSSSDGYNLADYFDSSSQNAPLYHSSIGIGEIMYNIYSILADAASGSTPLYVTDQH